MLKKQTSSYRRFPVSNFLVQTPKEFRDVAVLPQKTIVIFFSHQYFLNTNFKTYSFCKIYELHVKDFCFNKVVH